MIQIHDTDAIDLFRSNNVVFKITATIEDLVRDVHMVSTREDYERKLSSHLYTPLMFLVSTYERIAYLYDCLNRNLGVPRDEKYDFWWRKIGETEWQKWFTVSPYTDGSPF